MSDILVEVMRGGAIEVETASRRIEVEVSALGLPGPPGTGATDHGALSGLSDDDHPQYHTDARGDARYAGLNHSHAIAGVTGLQTALDAKEAVGVAASLVAAEAAARAAADSALDAASAAHAARTDNPHAVTKAQVGLGSVDNTADADKPVSAATAAALAGKANTGHGHAIADVTGLQAALDAKAAAASVYTIVQADAAIDTRIAAVVGAAPSALDTLAEIAAQLADDQNAVAALTVTVAGKAPAVHGHTIADVTGLQAALDAAGPGSTDDVPEGATNLYHTSGRVSALIAAAVGVSVQAYNATLAALSALTTTAFGRGLLELASAAALRTAIALPTSVTVGRLARFTDAAGAVGQTSGIFEDASGNVGIGTASPQASLHSVGAARIAQGVGGSNNYENALDIASITDPLNTSTVAVQAIPFRNGSRLFFGSATHKWLLNLSNTTGVEGMPRFSTADTLTIGSVSGTVPQSHGIGRIGQVLVYVASATGAQSSHQFWTNATGSAGMSSGAAERMRISAQGNVGIGTTAPAVSLDVAGPIRCASYTVATVPLASAGAGQIIYVSNESGGAVHAFSDGTEWRRVTDRAIIS